MSKTTTLETAVMPGAHGSPNGSQAAQVAPPKTRKPRTPAPSAPLDVRTTALQIARILELHSTQAERERVLEILHVMSPKLPA
jgi:hypothetical protein